MSGKISKINKNKRAYFPTARTEELIKQPSLVVKTSSGKTKSKTKTSIGKTKTKINILETKNKTAYGNMKQNALSLTNIYFMPKNAWQTILVQRKIKTDLFKKVMI